MSHSYHVIFTFLFRFGEDLPSPTARHSLKCVCRAFDKNIKAKFLIYSKEHNFLISSVSA